MTESQITPKSDRTDGLEDRLGALSRRIDELETRDQNRGRALMLSVVAIYAVLASLLMLHWAGHYFTQNS